MTYQHITSLPRPVFTPRTRSNEFHPVDRSVYTRLRDNLRRNYAVHSEKLNYGNPFELLVAAILLPQAEVAEVNEATEALFDAYPTPQAMVAANRRDIEKYIRRIGFYRQKSKYLQLASRMLLMHHDGEVPGELQDLTRLPGVARKTANFIMAELYDVAEGVIVDTRVSRVAKRLGLARGKSAEAIENQLMRVMPKEDWLDMPQLMIAHADTVCDLNAPGCADCPLKSMCPSAEMAN